MLLALFENWIPQNIQNLEGGSTEQRLKIAVMVFFPPVSPNLLCHQSFYQLQNDVQGIFMDTYIAMKQNKDHII